MQGLMYIKQSTLRTQQKRAARLIAEQPFYAIASNDSASARLFAVIGFFVAPVEFSSSFAFT
jgi:hypothetical protein